MDRKLLTTDLVAMLLLVMGLIILIVSLAVRPLRGADQRKEIQASTSFVLSPERIALGHKLFFDPILSATGNISCSTCHEPNRGWTDNRTVSVGANNLTTDRNAPTLINTIYQRLQFADGRALFVEGQTLQPLKAQNEMGPQTIEQALARLNASQTYLSLFQEAYGQPANASNLSVSLAAFVSTIVAHDAPIDRYLKGQTWALSSRQKRGLAVFQISGCTNCHNGPDYRTPASVANSPSLGLPQQLLLSDVFANTAIAARFGDVEQGRFTVTQQQSDFNRFKIPTLRDIGKTAPYMHNGQFTTIQEVVDHYRNPLLRRDGSTIQEGNIDRRIRPIVMTTRQREDLIHFLSTAFESYDYPSIPKPALPAR